jgi:parallel beta-helix repeat protein
MKKIISLIVAIGLLISIGTSFVTAAPLASEVWVDDGFDPSTPGWGSTHFGTLASGVANTASGGTLHLAAGNYQGVDLTSPITIIGEGPEVVTVYNYTDYVFDMSGVSFVSISGCTIVNGYAHNIYGQFSGTDSEIHINDCDILYAEMTDSGIHIEVEDADVDVGITGCLIKENTGCGIYLSYIGDASGSILIEDNELYKNTTGIDIDVGDGALSDLVDIDATIRGNYVHEHIGEFTGLSVNKECSGSLDLYIESNAFIDNDGDGIYVSLLATEGEPAVISSNGDGPNWSKVLIEDNAIIGNDMYGIEFEYTVLRANYDQSPEDFMDYFPLIDITRNYIVGNGNSGINVTYASESIDESRLGQVGPESIILPYVIDKNRVVGNGNDGIHMDNCFAWYVMNNLVADNYGCSASGIALEHSYCFLVNNTIHNNETHGIYISILGGSTLGQDNGYYEVPGFYVNNIVVENGSYGFYMPGSIDDNLGANGSEPGNLRSNNVWGNGLGNYSPSLYDFTGMYGNISQDPRFVSPDDRHLTRSSPCIDAGWDSVLEVLTDDLEDTSRPQARHVDMGCYELIWSSFTPETFHPLVITQLANANSMWTCLMDNLPDDPELMEEVEPMLEAVQAHMGNATSISNYVQANGELRQALAIMAEIDAMCECECIVNT